MLQRRVDSKSLKVIRTLATLLTVLVLLALALSITIVASEGSIATRIILVNTDDRRAIDLLK